MNEAIRKYLNYLKNIKYYSDKTVSSYFFDLNGFANYLKENELLVDEVIDKDIQSYINSLKKQNYKVSSLNRKIVCLRNFYKYYANEINPNASLFDFKNP